MAAVPSHGGLLLDERHVLMRRATWASLGVALGLVALKLGAWLWTGSVSVLASLVDSAIDALASGVILIAVHASMQPADREHRFGHGKLEPLAGLGQSMLVAGSAVALAVAAIDRIREPQPPQAGTVGLAVMAVASVATWLLVRYQRHVIARTGSTAVGADSLHFTSDLWMNAAVAMSLALSTWFGWTLADPLLAMAVAVLVGRSAWRIAHDAVQLLMDREFPDEDRARITAIVRSHPEVKGLHDLRTRQAGLQVFLQFHLELDGRLSLARAHKITEEVEQALLQAWPGAEIIIHVDPDYLPADEPGFDR